MRRISRADAAKAALVMKGVAYLRPSEGASRAAVTEVCRALLTLRLGVGHAVMDATDASLWAGRGS